MRLMRSQGELGRRRWDGNIGEAEKQNKMCHFPLFFSSSFHIRRVLFAATALLRSRRD